MDAVDEHGDLISPFVPKAQRRTIVTSNVDEFGDLTWFFVPEAQFAASQPPNPLTSVIVDEDGGLILFIGTETRFLVSSKALTLASKMFKAVLSRAAFKEGRELAERFISCGSWIVRDTNVH